MHKSIYLPLSFKSQKSIISSINELMCKTKINISKFKIKNHPGAADSNVHKDLISKINKIKIRNKSKNFLDDTSIFIGSSGAIIEALERGNKVIQICENPDLEKYGKSGCGNQDGFLGHWEDDAQVLKEETNISPFLFEIEQKWKKTLDNLLIITSEDKNFYQNNWLR